MKEKITFENFLRDKHYKEYHGTDDDMADDFDKWLTELQADDFIKYGEEYADWKIKECLPKKMNMTAANQTGSRAGFGFTKGWNRCREAMLINADIKCKGCGQERCRCGETYNEPYSGFDAVA